MYLHVMFDILLCLDLFNSFKCCFFYEMHSKSNIAQKNMLLVLLVFYGCVASAKNIKHDMYCLKIFSYRLNA
jgi:hypothetical protein